MRKPRPRVVLVGTYRQSRAWFGRMFYPERDLNHLSLSLLSTVTALEHLQKGLTSLAYSSSSSSSPRHFTASFKCLENWISYLSDPVGRTNMFGRHSVKQVRGSFILMQRYPPSTFTGSQSSTSSYLFRVPETHSSTIHHDLTMSADDQLYLVTYPSSLIMFVKRAAKPTRGNKARYSYRLTDD